MILEVFPHSGMLKRKSLHYGRAQGEALDRDSSKVTLTRLPFLRRSEIGG